MLSPLQEITHDAGLQLAYSQRQLTETVLLQMQNPVNATVDIKCVALVVGLDISAAFNKVLESDFGVCCVAVHCLC